MSLTALRPYLTVSGFSCDSRESVPKSPCFYFPQVKENRASYHKEANQAWRTNRDKQLILRGKNRENITFLPEEEEGAVLDHHPLLAPAIAYLLLPLPWRGGGGGLVPGTEAAGADQEAIQEQWIAPIWVEFCDRRGAGGLRHFGWIRDWTDDWWMQ